MAWKMALGPQTTEFKVGLGYFAHGKYQIGVRSVSADGRESPVVSAVYDYAPPATHGALFGGNCARFYGVS